MKGRRRGGRKKKKNREQKEYTEKLERRNKDWKENQIGKMNGRNKGMHQ